MYVVRKCSNHRAPKQTNTTGITVLSRDKASGELSVAQQFKIDQVPTYLHNPLLKRSGRFFFLPTQIKINQPAGQPPQHNNKCNPSTPPPENLRNATPPQGAGVLDIDGMIGANSVAVSPDGKFAYVSSGGYYRGAFVLKVM